MPSGATTRPAPAPALASTPLASESTRHRRDRGEHHATYLVTPACQIVGGHVCVPPREAPYRPLRPAPHEPLSHGGETRERPVQNQKVDLALFMPMPIPMPMSVFKFMGMLSSSFSVHHHIRGHAHTLRSWWITRRPKPPPPNTAGEKRTLATRRDA